MTARRERILIIRLAALGDVVMASTILQRIRREHPDAHVTWLCGAGARPLVQLFDGVDEIIAVDEARLLLGGMVDRLREVATLWSKLLRRRFDRVLLGHPDPRYRVLVGPIPSRRVHAFRRSQDKHSLPSPGRFAGDEFARLLDPAGSHLGPIIGHWEVADVRAKLSPARVLPPADATGAKWIVLVPGGARNIMRDDALRRWPVDRYAALARALLAAGHRVAIVGDPGDAWVRPHFAGTDVEDRLGAHSLEGTLALMRDSDLVIAHDTGPMHLARLVRAPLIALFGPTNPRERVVEDERTVTLWGGADLACRPCYDGRNYADCVSNRCMQEISVETIIARAQVLLQGERRDTRGAAAGTGAT